MNKKLIAPCGMNCNLCFYHLKPESKCPGCNFGREISGRCLKCAIKLCKKRKGDFCFDCKEFPCDKITRLDKRYKDKYEMSEIENLKNIKKIGLEKFVENEKKRWVNKDGIYCVHDKKRY